MATRGYQSRQTHATRRPLHTSKDSRTPSPRRGRRGSVTFDHQTSIFPEDGDGEERQGVLKGAKGEEEEIERRPGRGSCYGCHFLVENKVARRLFRVCAVLNLISLMFSAPWKRCDPPQECDPDVWGDCCDLIFVQLVIITILDTLLALVYTIQTYVRFQYSLYQREKNKQV